MPDTMAPQRAASIESRASWTAAWVTLGILSISYGAPLLVVVGLKPIQEALDTDRSVGALAGALVWMGTGVGGIMMGWLADRIGIRSTVTIGAVMMASGLALSATGSVWALYVGHGLLIGLVGNGAIFAPLVVYVSRWFDRRRGSALALISSGQYIAGIVWPSVFERGITLYGWQITMVAYSAVVIAIILPLASLCLRPSPEAHIAHALSADPRKGAPVLGMPPNLVLALICIAVFFCCIPMAVPNGHLVAFCTDLGIAPTHGAAMLSVLLACAFLSRQFWGMVADRVGGLRAVMAGSACQAVAIGAFLLTQNEMGCSLSPPRSGSAFPASSRPMSWRSASCFCHPRRRGACRLSSFSACPAWRSEFGWPASCMTGSASMRRRSRSACCLTSPTSQ